MTAPSSAALTQHDARSVARSTAAKLGAAYAALSLIWIGAGMLIRSRLFAGLRSWDAGISRSMVPHRTETLNRVAYYVAQGADTYIKIGVTTLLALLFAVVWRRWNEPALVAFSLVLEAAVFITVTMVVRRPRPNVAHLEASPVASSFPSGHTAAAAVYASLAVIVFWHTRKRIWRVCSVAASLVAPICVGLARVYAGMHNTTDVMAGALLGYATLYVVARIVRPSVDAEAATAASGRAGGDGAAASERWGTFRSAG